MRKILFKLFKTMEKPKNKKKVRLRIKLKNRTKINEPKKSQKNCKESKPIKRRETIQNKIIKKAKKNKTIIKLNKIKNIKVIKISHLKTLKKITRQKNLETINFQKNLNTFQGIINLTNQSPIHPRIIDHKVINKNLNPNSTNSINLIKNDQ